MTIRYPPIAPPDHRAALGELRFGLELLRSAPRWLFPRRTAAAESVPVMLLPGFGASGRSMVALSRYLAAAGHQVADWGLGRNTGRVPKLLAAIRDRILSMTDELGEPLTMVGWSLGGYLAREVAREIPDRVRKVITLGSPIIGGPRFTAAAGWYRTHGFDLDEIEREVADRYLTPLTVPVVAIYSKRDGIVAWEACVDRWSPRVRHVEVDSTHLGLAFSPQVLEIVATEVGAR